VNVHGALPECCTIFWGLLAEWHSYKLSEMQNKYRNSLSVLQAKTRPNCPKARSFRFLLCKYKWIGVSYLEVMTGSDSA